MGLVAAISSECGVRSLGPAGKITWFTVGDPPELDPDDLLAGWDLDEEWREDEQRLDMVPVVLEAMPATLYLSARQHHDALLRELVLSVAEHDDVSVDLVATDEARFQIANPLVHAIEAAHSAGTARPALPSNHPSPLPWVPEDLDPVIDVSADAGSRFAAMQDALDTGERLAKAGDLLVRPGLPEIVAVRDWACEQVIAQLAGSPPVPWPGTADERFETDGSDEDAPAHAWDASLVMHATRGVVAADDANRILAISEPLASLLGWDRDALVGRRVVTLIPPALREAHVAGFSRHLSTGEAHILGVPLELPVLRADGTDVLCRFMVERDETGAAGVVYLAWIDAVATTT